MHEQCLASASHRLGQNGSKVDRTGVVATAVAPFSDAAKFQSDYAAIREVREQHY